MKDNWLGLVPDRGGGPPGVWHWETTAKKPNESWETYCERTAQESLLAVTDLKVEQDAREDVAAHIWFNVTYVESHEV